MSHKLLVLKVQGGLMLFDAESLPDLTLAALLSTSAACRSMVKAGLVGPVMELCCSALETRAPQQSEDSLRGAMLVLHEAIKSPSLHGTSPLLCSGLEEGQVRS